MATIQSIKQLNEEIWKHEEIWSDVYGKGYYSQPTRKLEDHEIRIILRLCRRKKLAMEVGSWGMMRGFCVNIYDQAPAFGLDPTLLLSFCNEHLVGDWSDAFDMMEPYFNSPKNHQLLKYYGMRLPERKVRYDY